MKRKPLSYAMSPLRWAKLLGNWSDAPECGEKNLLVWAIGQWISEGSKTDPPFEDGFFHSGGGFDAYCKAVSLDPDFVREQIERARHKEMGPHQPLYLESA